MADAARRWLSSRSSSLPKTRRLCCESDRTELLVGIVEGCSVRGSPDGRQMTGTLQSLGISFGHVTRDGKRRGSRAEFSGARPRRSSPAQLPRRFRFGGPLTGLGEPLVVLVSEPQPQTAIETRSACPAVSRTRAPPIKMSPPPHYATALASHKTYCRRFSKTLPLSRPTVPRDLGRRDVVDGAGATSALARQINSMVRQIARLKREAG